MPLKWPVFCNIMVTTSELFRHRIQGTEFSGHFIISLLSSTEYLLLATLMKSNYSIVNSYIVEKSEKQKLVDLGVGMGHDKVEAVLDICRILNRSIVIEVIIDYFLYLITSWFRTVVFVHEDITRSERNMFGI